MANEYTWPEQFDLIGLLQHETGYLEKESEERRGVKDNADIRSINGRTSNHQIRKV
jgi:hypothetical protein